MDAPDVDELEWMAMQNMIPYEDDDNGLENIKSPNPPISDSLGLVNPTIAVDSYTTAFSKGNLLEASEVYPRIISNADHVKRPRDEGSGCLETSSKRAQIFSADCLPLSPSNTPYVRERSLTYNALCQDVELQPHHTVENLGIQEKDMDILGELPCKRAIDIEGDCMPVTGLSDMRVYLKILEVPTSRLQSSKVFSRCGLGLLSKPIHTMIEEAERETFEGACKFYSTTDMQDVVETSSRTKDEELWVDKYAPKSFTELLSDEQTNREVLSWLKQWDSCVFGARQTSCSKQVLATLRRKWQPRQDKVFATGRNTKSDNDGDLFSSKQAINTTSNGFQKAIGQMNNGELDQKVLLLCGSPGLGKTTLAHVAAKHCGYRVVEINASDDRVATTLQGKILDAIQMKSVMGDCKPNCLIIDEIDGALGGIEGKSAIASLLEIVSVEKKLALAKGGEFDEALKKSKRKGGANVNKLSRPVICICNDQYVPTLRLLRQVARVHVFVQPSINRVVTRLKSICSKEHYKANPRALTALAEHTDCDIRSCLNTLQFLHRKKEDLKMLDVASQIIGRKDMTTSIFDIWSEIFQKQKMRPASAVRSGDALQNVKQEEQEFFRLHELFFNHGDHELTFNGIFENFLNVRYHDSSLQKTSKCLDAICDSDIFGRRAFSRQQFFINAYQPSLAIAIRRIIAQMDRPKLEWPKAFQKNLLEFSANKDMIRSWLSIISPLVSRCLSYSSLVEDILYFLLAIISPNLRTVASQLLSSVERDLLSQLVDTMIGYGMSYKVNKVGIKHEYITDNQGLVLEPPVHKVTIFKDLVPTYRPLSSTLCQMITHEVELEKIRRETAARIARVTAAASSHQNISQNMESIQSTNVEGSDTTSVRGTVAANQECSSSSKCQNVATVEVKGAHSQNIMLAAKNSARLSANVKRPMNAGDQQSSGFFNRFKKSSANVTTSEGSMVENKATLQRDSRPLLYKFHEGFTNAVKRPIFMRDFL